MPAHSDGHTILTFRITRSVGVDGRGWGHTPISWLHPLGSSIFGTHPALVEKRVFTGQPSQRGLLDMSFHGCNLTQPGFGDSANSGCSPSNRRSRQRRRYPRHPQHGRCSAAIPKSLLWLAESGFGRLIRSTCAQTIATPGSEVKNHDQTHISASPKSMVFLFPSPSSEDRSYCIGQFLRQSQRLYDCWPLKGPDRNYRKQK